MTKKFDSDNALLSFHIYMWNTWSKEECIQVFNSEDQEYKGSLAEHIWNMWLDWCGQVGPIAASSLAVCNLDTENLNKLIDRACEIYDGSKYRE